MSNGRIAAAPANVPALGTPSSKAPKTTVREKLESHRSDPNCTACHQKIDPFGLAFDNYDAIGRWRMIETVKNGSGADPNIDPSGTLYDGRSFADARARKRLLVDDLDKFADAFAEKLATYAFRRAMNVSDRAHLKRIVAESRRNGYEVASMIEQLVTSDFFRSR